MAQSAAAFLDDPPSAGAFLDAPEEKPSAAAFLDDGPPKDFWETDPQPVTPSSDSLGSLITAPAGGIDTTSLGTHLADPAWVASRGSLNLSAAGAYAEKLLLDAAKHTLTPQNEPDDSEGTRFAPNAQEQQLAEKASEPVVNLPYPTGRGAAASTARGFIQKANPILTTENAALAGLSGGLPTLAQRGAGIAFVAPMAKELPERLKAAWDAPTTKERYENVGGAIADSALVYFGLKEGLGGRSGRTPTGNLQPTHTLPEWVKQETGQEINQANPSPASIDGLLLAKEKAGEGFFDLTLEKQAERKTIIGEIDTQLNGMPADAVKAGEERVAQRGQSPPPTSEEAPPVSPEGPPAKSGSASNWKQALAESGVTPEPPSAAEFLDEEPTSISGPVLVKNGEVVAKGEIGSDHDQLEAQSRITDATRAFQDSNGGILNRTDAAKVADESGQRTEGSGPLHSSQLEPIADPAMHQAALDNAERIATSVTSGQGDILQRAARDAAYDKIKKNMDGGHPTLYKVRDSAKEAAGKAAKEQPASLDAEKAEGQNVGDTVASEEPTPAQTAAKADMIDAVQKQVEALPADIQKTAKAFLEAAQNGESTSLRDLGEKLGVSQQTVANHLAKMRSAFKGLKEEGYSVGPGAASISEQLGESLLSIKNASTAEGRKAAGLPERDAVGRRTFGDIWDQAVKSFDEDPQVGKKLVDELAEKSRPLTDREDAVLTHELGDRQQEYDEALHDVSEAQTPQEHASAKTRLDAAREALHQVYDVSEKAGTENARGLSARRLMVKSDYSLVGVERKLRDNLGRDVSEEERGKLEKPVEAVEKADEKAKAAEEEFTKAKEDEETRNFVEATINELGNAYLKDENGVKFDSRILGIAEKIVKGLESQADSALKRIRARRAEGRVNALAVDDLIDYSIYGAAKIARKGLDFTQWAAEMVKDIGPMSKDVLHQVWEASQKHLDELGAKTGNDAEKIKQVIKKKAPQTPIEAKAAAKAEKVAGDKLSQKTVVDYVRSLINAGEHGTDNLMKKAHEGLKEAFPDVTERDVRRAFVDYGKKTYPSKEAVAAEIRESKQIVKIQEDIDREMEGQQGIVNPETGELMGAEKQGYQRDKATQKVRELIKQRNELLKNRTGPPSPEKLASRDEAKQTALRNSIEDLDKQLRTGEKPVRGEPAPDSAQTEQLRAERDALKAKLDEIEKAANPPKSADERYNETRVKQIQKELVKKQAYLDQLRKSGVVPPKPSVAVKTKFAALAKAEAELTAKRREVDDAVRKIVYENRSTPAKIKEGALNALKLVTSVKVLGHGTVGMFTHAGGLAWRPTVAKIFWTNFGKQFKLWTSKAYHDQAVLRLKSDPEFQTWKDAGASIDPEQTYTDYGLYAKWLGKLGEAGGRGFDALKLTRLELNKATWDKVPASVKADPVAAAETRKAIADINNKATGAIPRVPPVTPEGAPNRISNGVYNLAKNPLADAVFFAPKLYASRWARVVLDPVKTVGTLADWKNASVADKTAAKIRMKNAGQFAAVYVGALLVNKGLLAASGSNQDVNISDPTRPDWLKFKGAGKEVVADGGLLDPIRLLGQIVVGDILNVRTKNQQYREGTRYQKITEDLGRYARSKFNPTLGLAVDATTGTDYAGKPLPFSNEPPKYKDQGKYTWPEWLMQQGPIPISQGVKVAYDEMHKNGMSHVQIMQILKGAAVAAIGGTGVHVTEDHPRAATNQQSGTKKSPLRR